MCKYQNCEGTLNLVSVAACRLGHFLAACRLGHFLKVEPHTNFVSIYLFIYLSIKEGLDELNMVQRGILVFEPEFGFLFTINIISSHHLIMPYFKGLVKNHNRLPTGSNLVKNNLNL